MTRLPRVTGAHVVWSLRKVGFAVVRQRGSHVIMKHPDGRSTVVSVHSGENNPCWPAVQDSASIAIDRETFIGLLGN